LAIKCPLTAREAAFIFHFPPNVSLLLLSIPANKASIAASRIGATVDHKM
jgi:hypothetical protein